MLTTWVLRLRTFLGLTLVAVGVAMAGCEGPDGPMHYPVSGIVTLDGKPLAQAGVMFLPRGNTLGGACLGLTDAQGRYMLRPERGRGTGAPIGEFAVTISKMKLPAAKAAWAQPSAAETGLDETLSAKYWDSSLTILRARVPEGGTTVNFALRSRP